MPVLRQAPHVGGKFDKPFLTMLRRTEVILFILFSCGIVLLTVAQFSQTFFIYGLLQLLLYFLFGLTLLYTIYKAIKNKRRLTVAQRLLPLLFGLSFIPVFYLTSYLVETDGGKSRLMSAGLNADLFFTHIDLWTDSTFKFLSSGPFGGDIYRGHYKLSHDTLQLDNDNLKRFYPSLTFTIKQGQDNRKYFEPTNDTSKYKYNLYIHSDH